MDDAQQFSILAEAIPALLCKRLSGIYRVWVVKIFINSYLIDG